LRKKAYLFVFVGFFILATAGGVRALNLYSQQRALALAFPDVQRLEKETHILSADQVAEIQRLSRSRVESRLVTLHRAWREEELLGTANIDVHRVRTHDEALMVVLGPTGRVLRVQVLSFAEPLEYMPSARWYELFVGKGKEDSLRVGHDIDAVSGATLTTRATADAVRRTLAFHRVLQGG
jgi:hypothetical protein